MTHPMPAGNITRLCVICFHHGTHRPATHLTHHRGYALCDGHKHHSNTEIRTTLLSKKRRR
jgi:hypothetical protein